MKAKLYTKRSLLAGVASVMMLLAAQSGWATSYTALSGTGGTGGEGFAKLVDGNDRTKWGQSFVYGSTEAYVIFKSSVPVVPSNYCIIIANDTQQNPGRNWASWNVYAANFASDEEAVKDAAAWVLVDKKENEMVPTENFKACDYVCSEGISDTYSYFMVEVTACNQSDVYMQMGEFAWGTADEFYNSSKPSYTVLEGTKHDGSGECVDKMFDGSTGTKWYNADCNDTYVIFKSTRDIAPTYYCVTTANDNYTYTGRNWTTWSIYGLAAESDDAVSRDANWVLLDQRVDNHDIPDANYTEVFFTPTEGVTEKFHYFMIKIDASAGGNFQVSEFYLGDAGTFNLAKEEHYKAALLDLSKPMQKSLAADYLATVEAIMTASDIYVMNDLYKKAVAAQDPIKASQNAYDSYVYIVTQLRNHYENHTCITGEGRTVVGNYLDTNAAPSELYPNGTYAYVIENGLLDVDGINDESIFVNMMMEKYASDLTDGAIDVAYETVWGRAGFGNEGFEMLFDGDDYTKWCSGNGDYWVVFHTSEPICPTYYRLVTGNDTKDYPDRNWKSWKVYGANFTDDPEKLLEEATDLDEPIRTREEWVLLDEKNNVGTDILPAANYMAAFVYMTNPSDTPYDYFLIEISDPQGTMQMCEFTFGNGANFILTRQEYYEHFTELDPEGTICYQGYVTDYKKTLERMKTTASMVELSSLYNTLTGLLNNIEASVEAYTEFDFAVEELRGALGYMNNETADYWDKFLNDNEAPSTEYPYGTYDYIMENYNLDNETMTAFYNQLYDLAKAALEGGFCVIWGNMASWGENENYFKLVDKDMTTKWGGNLPAEGASVIFYSMEPTAPLFYKLTTGNDTQSNPGRNWKDWQIYGGNFVSDAEATVDAEGWVLLEDRKGIGQDRLPAENFFTVPFGFSEGVNEEYKYFKVTVTAAYSGSSIQMTELEFGTEEEFEEIRQEYYDNVTEFNVEDVVAQDALLDAYYEAEEKFYEAENMEDLYNAYNTMQLTYNRILISYKAYINYVNKVAELIAIADKYENNADLMKYLNEKVAAGAEFPNGSAPVVVDEHKLSDEELIAEIAFMNKLAAEALKGGYKAGADVTALVVNPSFQYGSEGWNGEVFGYDFTYDYAMSAAEFCNDQAKFHVYQTLTGLKNGYYAVSINGGVRPGNDKYSTNYSAMLYAGDNKVYVKADLDGMIDVADAEHLVNCWLGSSIADMPIASDPNEETDTIGYVLHGIQSTCYAALAGRYDNTIIAEVTDGTLTFGVKNDCVPNGGDWTGLANTKLIYLGDLDSEYAAAALDKALANQQIIAQSLTDYEGYYDEADYKTLPYVCESDLKAIKANLASNPASGAAKYDVIVKNSALFQDIYDAKFEYIKTFDVAKLVLGKYESHEEKMAEGEATKFENAVYGVIDGTMGQYTAAEAVKAAADLKAAYPCYIDLDKDKTFGSIEIAESALFSYDIQADGNRPNIGLNKCMYEPLTADQTIVAFEYKCDQDLEGGALYFAHPSLNATECVTYGTLPAAADWTKCYISIANNYGWGTDTSHWMRWDFASTGKFNISVRNMLIITTEEMKAQGGEALAIESILMDNDVPATFIYNLQGQRVTEDYKGIIIMNGKKYLNK